MELKRPADDKTCAYCDHYTFKAREEGDTDYGWAFCLKHGKWFKDQQAGTPAGKRTCPGWS